MHTDFHFHFCVYVVASLVKFCVHGCCYYCYFFEVFFVDIFVHVLDEKKKRYTQKRKETKLTELLIVNEIY